MLSTVQSSLNAAPPPFYFFLCLSVLYPEQGRQGFPCSRRHSVLVSISPIAAQWSSGSNSVCVWGGGDVDTAV